MKSKKKKKNDLIEISKVDIFKPLTIDQIGTNGDPCFGINYDLTTSECKQCGDSELCAMVFARKLNTTRQKLNKENHYKDLDVLIDIKGVNKKMKQLKKAGKSKKEILSTIQEEFTLTREDARSLYRKCFIKTK